MQALHDLDTHNHTATLSHLHQCTHREGRKSQSEARALFAITPAPTLFSTLRQQAGHTNALCLWLRLDFIHPILFACGHTQIHKAAGAEMLCQDGMETGHLIDAHKKMVVDFLQPLPVGSGDTYLSPLPVSARLESIPARHGVLEYSQMAIPPCPVSF